MQYSRCKYNHFVLFQTFLFTFYCLYFIFTVFMVDINGCCYPSGNYGTAVKCCMEDLTFIKKNGSTTFKVPPLHQNLCLINCFTCLAYPRSWFHCYVYQQSDLLPAT